MLQDNFDLVRRIDASQLRQLRELFEAEWWTKGRTIQEIEAMLDGPSAIFAFVERKSGRLAAFARVLSDGAFKALVFDVIVSPDFRARGLGTALVERVLAEPEVARVKHVELYCLDGLTTFYRRFGFSSDVSDVRLLRRDRSDSTTPQRHD